MRRQAIPTPAAPGSGGPADGQHPDPAAAADAWVAANPGTDAAGPPLGYGGAKELERVKEALEPCRPPAETKPRAKDPMKAWIRAGRAKLGGRAA